jgi:hypothetical protein
MALTGFDNEAVYEIVFSFLDMFEKKNEGSHPFFDPSKGRKLLQPFIDNNPLFISTPADTNNGYWDMMEDMFFALNEGLKTYAILTQKRQIVAYRFGHLCFCFKESFQFLTKKDIYTGTQGDLNNKIYKKFVEVILPAVVNQKVAKSYSKGLKADASEPHVIGNSFSVLADNDEKCDVSITEPYEETPSQARSDNSPSKKSWLELDAEESDGEDIPRKSGFTAVSHKKSSVAVSKPKATMSFKSAVVNSLPVPIPEPPKTVIAPSLSGQVPQITHHDVEFVILDVDANDTISGTFTFQVPPGEDVIKRGGRYILKGFRLAFVKSTH